MDTNLSSDSSCDSSDFEEYERFSSKGLKLCGEKIKTNTNSTALVKNNKNFTIDNILGLDNKSDETESVCLSNNLNHRKTDYTGDHRDCKYILKDSTVFKFKFNFFLN